MNTNFIDELMLEAKASVTDIVKNSNGQTSQVIARYTAAFAVNFTDWIGRTLVWVGDDYAWSALNENLKCEVQENHTKLLFDFAELSYSVPKSKDYKAVASTISDIRESLSCSRTGSLFGIALLATLENTSEIFIPDLAKKAEGLGCKNLKYTDTREVSDFEYRDQLIQALKKESELLKVSEEDIKFYARSGMKRAQKLLLIIYS